MSLIQVAVTIFCGLLIGLAVFQFIRTIRKMAKGRCCEGCAGCTQASNCSSREDKPLPPDAPER